MAYEPKPSARVGMLIAAMRADPNPKRLWSPADCAQVMHLKPRQVSNFTAYAVAHAVIYATKIGKSLHYSLHMLEASEVPQPAPKRPRRGVHSPKCRGHYTQPLDDIRIPKVDPTWRPPVMVAPRAGSSL